MSFSALLTAKNLIGDPLPGAQRAIRLADKSGDGKLTLAEYLPLDVQSKHHGEEHFKGADTDHNGFLDLKEFGAHAEAKLGKTGQKKEAADGPAQ